MMEGIDGPLEIFNEYALKKSIQSLGKARDDILEEMIGRADDLLIVLLHNSRIAWVMSPPGW